VSCFLARRTDIGPFGGDLREGGREGGREGKREGGREGSTYLGVAVEHILVRDMDVIELHPAIVQGGRKGGKEGGREGGKAGGREGGRAVPTWA